MTPYPVKYEVTHDPAVPGGHGHHHHPMYSPGGHCPLPQPFYSPTHYSLPFYSPPLPHFNSAKLVRSDKIYIAFFSMHSENVYVI